MILLKLKYPLIFATPYFGALAQLARAFDWQSKGRRFVSAMLHPDNQALTVFRCECFFYLHTICTRIEILGIFCVKKATDNIEWS